MKIPRHFECCIEEFTPGYDFKSTVIALSHSQARYRFWHQNQEVLNSYSDDFRFIKVRSLGNPDPSLFFMDQEGFERMCEHRSIQFAYMGMTVDINGKKGIITGYIGFNLAVMLDGNLHPYSNCHPNWETTYYDSSWNILADFKIKKP